MPSTIHFTLLVAAVVSTLFPLSTTAVPRSLLKLAKRRDAVAPDDFSWIKSFTAIGDSYAAGIGAGDALSGAGDSDCSRYTGAYSQQMNSMLGPSDRTYNFIACSGALAPEIKDKQVSTIADNSQDLISVSAGGNDALFSDVLLACIYTPSSDTRCQKALDDAEKVINDIKQLWQNIDDLVTAIDEKVADGGIVVWTLYGQFFNTDSDLPCSDQSWCWFKGVVPGDPGLKVTKDLRGKMNDLVVAANKQIASALASFTGGTRPHKMKLIVVDWDNQAGNDNGRFCNADSANDPNDPSNLGLVFQRLDPTDRNLPGGTGFARLTVSDKAATNGSTTGETGSSKVAVSDKAVANNSTLGRRTVVFGDDPSKEAGSVSHHELTRRAALDDIKRVFHPTELGGSLMAAMALSKLSTVMSKGFQPKPCPKNGDGPGGGGSDGPYPDIHPTCNGDQWKTWMFRDPGADAVEKFCSDPSKVTGTPGSKTDGEFNQGTSDHVRLSIDFKTVKGDYTLDEDACKHWFLTVLDGCDIPTIRGNPMNLKHGGSLDHPDGFHIELQPQEDEPERKCTGLQDGKYLDREKLKKVILDGDSGFCKDVEDRSNDSNQGSRFSQTYTTHDNPGPDADLPVLMIASWPDGIKIQKQQCYDQLVKYLLSNCDGGTLNPYDYKAGGDLYVGKVLYLIEPLTKRSPAPTLPAKTDGSCTGDCDSYCGKQEWGVQGHDAAIDKGKMLGCMDDVFTHSVWGIFQKKTECDSMVYFHLGSSGWGDPRDCYNACKNCLSENVNDGASAVWCDAWAGPTHGAHCWMGFDQNSG